jgi:hypothetical protein
MSDESDVRLPPLPLPFLKQLQEVEAFTRSALVDCNFPGTKQLDDRKAIEVMQASLIAVLDIRLDHYETVPGYEWKWSTPIGSHSVASILACFPSSRYVKQSEDDSLEYEGDLQFLGELIRTGWDHMEARRIGKGDMAAAIPSVAMIAEYAKIGVDLSSGSPLLKMAARAFAQGTKPAPAVSDRMPSTINSPSAARKMEAYLAAKGIGLTDFASTAGTTDRTLRSFRKTGKIRRSILTNIAASMGVSKEDLLK